MGGSGRSSKQDRTIYVGNLPGDIRIREVEDLFYKYGPIVDIDLKLPPRPPGYAFVEFEDYRDAEAAIRGRDDYDFDGHRLRVEIAHRGKTTPSVDRYTRVGSRVPPRHWEYRVLVTGLPSSASWQDLKDHMRLAGEVTFSQVFRDRGGMTGIADYTNYEDMKYAIRKLDDSEFRNAFSRSYIRVRKYDSRRSYSRSPSPYNSRRSRSISASRSLYNRGRSYARSPSVSSRSRSRSRSRSYSKSPRARYFRSSLSRSVSPCSRSVSPARSISSIFVVSKVSASRFGFSFAAICLYWLNDPYMRQDATIMRLFLASGGLHVSNLTACGRKFLDSFNFCKLIDRDLMENLKAIPGSASTEKTIQSLDNRLQLADCKSSPTRCRSPYSMRKRKHVSKSSLRSQSRSLSRSPQPLHYESYSIETVVVLANVCAASLTVALKSHFATRIDLCIMHSAAVEPMGAESKLAAQKC
ncbi:hypothetical protein ACFE04_027886 [Oxalis oulophora]